MIAGKLRNRVQIQRAATVQDEYGEPVSAVYTLATVWAQIRPKDGRETDYGGAFAATVSHKITIRYFPGLLPTDEVVYGNRYFSIQAVTDPEERTREMVLWCTESVPQAVNTTPSDFAGLTGAEFASMTAGQFAGLDAV